VGEGIEGPLGVRFCGLKRRNNILLRLVILLQHLLTGMRAVSRMRMTRADMCVGLCSSRCCEKCCD